MTAQPQELEVQWIYEHSPAGYLGQCAIYKARGVPSVTVEQFLRSKKDRIRQKCIFGSKKEGGAIA